MQVRRTGGARSKSNVQPMSTVELFIGCVNYDALARERSSAAVTFITRHPTIIRIG